VTISQVKVIPKIKFKVINLRDTSQDDAAVLKEINKRLAVDRGFTVEFDITKADLSGASTQFDQINLKLAAGELDAFTCSWSPRVADYIYNKGIMLPLDGLLDKYGPNIKAKVQSTTWNAVKVDGATMGIPVNSPTTAWVLSYIRRDLLDAAGLGMPKTMDELENALYTLKKKNPDKLGIVADYAGWLLGSTFLGAATPANQLDSEGNLLPNLEGYYYETPEFKAYLVRMAKWYKDGIINPEIYTWTPDKTLDIVNQNKAIMWAAGKWETGGMDAAPNQKWEPLLDLKTPDGRPFLGGYGDSPDRFIGIAANSKVAKEFVMWLDWLAEKPENFILADSGLENKDYKLVDGKIKPLDLPQGQEQPYKRIYSDIAPYQYGKEMSELLYSDPTKYAGSFDHLFYDPEKTKTAVSIDNKILYSFKKTGSKINDFNTLFDSTFQKIVLGAAGIETLDEMIKTLNDMGIKDYFQEKNEQFQKYYVK
jgi:putative aldouronate transport system substrate-binding protein